VTNTINDQTKYIQKSIIDYCSNSKPPPQPQDIESIDGVFVGGNTQHSQQTDSQSVSYKVHVKACPTDDRVDRYYKNNDIYGIEGKK
jgi:hypothetical protein